MRKVLLAAAGIGTGVTMLVMFGVSILFQCVSAQAQELPQVQGLVFPYIIEGTDLEAQQLVWYEGPFWEDGSEKEVVNAAALLVENTGCMIIAEGAVVLEWDGGRMVFEIHDLPPGSRVLVLEKDAQSFRRDMPEQCYGWARGLYPEDMGHVTVEDSQGAGMTVVNHTNGTVPVTRICYKTRDPASGIFIGGISYAVEVRDLQPGERREISPHHYACGSSQVVYITTWVEE